MFEQIDLIELIGVFLGLSVLGNVLLGALIYHRGKPVRPIIANVQYGLTVQEEDELYDAIVQRRTMRWCLRMDRVKGRSGPEKAEYVTKKIQRAFPNLSPDDISGLIENCVQQVNR